MICIFSSFLLLPRAVIRGGPPIVKLISQPRGREIFSHRTCNFSRASIASSEITKLLDPREQDRSAPLPQKRRAKNPSPTKIKRKQGDSLCVVITNSVSLAPRPLWLRLILMKWE